MSKVTNISNFVRKRNIETLLQQDFYEYYQERGKDFVIKVMSYIVRQLMEIKD